MKMSTVPMPGFRYDPKTLLLHSSGLCLADEGPGRVASRVACKPADPAQQWYYDSSRGDLIGLLRGGCLVAAGNDAFAVRDCRLGAVPPRLLPDGVEGVKYTAVPPRSAAQRGVNDPPPIEPGQASSRPRDTPLRLLISVLFILFLVGCSAVLLPLLFPARTPAKTLESPGPRRSGA